MAVAMMLGFSISASAGKKGGGSKKDDGSMISGQGLRGLLTVSTNETGALLAHIDPKNGSLYNIVISSLIQPASELKAMSGMEVLAKGEIKEVDGKKWLTVDGLIAKADASNTPPAKSKKKKK